MTKEQWARLAELGATIARDIAGLGGVVMIILGIGEIYRPAGEIAAGLFALAYAILPAMARRPRKAA